MIVGGAELAAAELHATIRRFPMRRSAAALPMRAAMLS
jgi:hypothetical protein